MSTYKNKQIKLNDQTYTLHCEIGTGGSGCVWKAVSDDGLEYAVKFLKPTEDNKKVERFKNEIDFCKHSNHPNVLKVHGDGTYNGQIFYIMSLYNGTLRDIISSERNYLKLLDYSIELGNALLYVHSLGVVHRDIKPENVFVDKDGQLVLGDFGIAHFADANLTAMSDWLGNKNYASPEQNVLKNANNITTACDIYSFGLILNELFTKRKPSGMYFEEIADRYPHLQALDEIAHRCLIQEPARRPSMESILFDLQLFRGELVDQLDKIKKSIMRKKNIGRTSKKDKVIVNKASEDVLFAKDVFWRKSNRELDLYNENYHADICYSVDDFLKNLFFQKKLLETCQYKFDYESISDARGTPYEHLDLRENDQLKLYNALEIILNKYKLEDIYEETTGRILKLFSSCADHHCQEILREIPHIEQQMQYLDNSPILCIVCLLREVLDFGEYKAIDLSEHLSICWPRMGCNWQTGDQENLYKKVDDEEEKEILHRTNQTWGCICRKEDETFYVTFPDREKYKAFKKEVLDFSKPYFVLSADVRALIHIYREFEGIVELRLNSFDVNYTLAKLFGLKEPC